MRLAREVSLPARPLGLSDLRLPYRAAMNPEAAAAGSFTKRLALDTGVLRPHQERFFDEFNDLSARFYPQASKDGLMLGTLLISWLFFLDDSYDRDATFASDVAGVRALMEGCLEVLSTGVLPARPLPLHLYSREFRDRLMSMTDTAWLARFQATVEDYLLRGSLEVVKSWSASATVEVETYMERRVHDSGVLPCVDLLEPLGRYVLPAHVLRDPAVQDLRHLCARVIAHANDLVSYENEVIVRDKPNNLVRLLMQRDRLSFEAAVSATVDFINRDVQAFTSISDGLPRWGEPVDSWLYLHARGMESLMKGNLDWSLTSRRYCTASSPFPELRI